MILTGGPPGKVLLFAVVIGLGAYSIWGFVRAVFDPLQRGDDILHGQTISARPGGDLGGLQVSQEDFPKP